MSGYRKSVSYFFEIGRSEFEVSWGSRGQLFIWHDTKDIIGELVRVDGKWVWDDGVKYFQSSSRATPEDIVAYLNENPVPVAEE